MPKAKISENALLSLRKACENAGLTNSFEEIKEIYISILEACEDMLKSNDHNKRIARI
jgi:hypothetical protein